MGLSLAGIRQKVSYRGKNIENKSNEEGPASSSPDFDIH